MMKTITHKYGNQIIVTQIEQFSVPAYLHGDDIMDAIILADGWWQIDFHGFKCAMSGPNVRNEIYGKALDYFRQFGVMLQGGTYSRIGWVEAGRHKPMHGETVLVTGKGYTATACWTGTNWLASDGRKDAITHWQRLPMSPECEKELQETP